MIALLRHRAVSAMAVSLLLLAGCSQANKPAAPGSAAANAPTTAAPQLVTAQTAFAPMYKSARAWSPDVEMLTLRPKEVPGFKEDAGKAAMWEASFASKLHHQYRIYTYSIATVPPEIHKGVGAGFPLAWAGETRSVMPVDLALFTVDSDAAFKAASAEAAAWLAKNPNKELSSLDLGSTFKFQAPVWYVTWGDTKSGYVAFIDATSGKVYKSK
jgi:hypothetical protein